MTLDLQQLDRTALATGSAIIHTDASLGACTIWPVTTRLRYAAHDYLRQVLDNAGLTDLSTAGFVEWVSHRPPDEAMVITDGGQLYAVDSTKEVRDLMPVLQRVRDRVVAIEQKAAELGLDSPQFRPDSRPHPNRGRLWPAR